MTGQEPARRGEGVAALLPSYSAPRLGFSLFLLVALGILWGLGDVIVGVFGGGDEYFAEDFQSVRDLVTFAAGTLLLVMLVGEEILLALLLAGMTGVTFVQVVLRYAFGSGLLWGLEVTGYMFGWLVLIGISYGIRVNAHIGIDLVVKAMPGLARRVFGVIAVALSMVYTGFMLYGGIGYLERLHRLGIEAEDIPLQRWLLTIVLPVGFILLGIRLLEILVGIIAGTRSGFDLPDEAKELIQESGLIDEGSLDEGKTRTTVPAGGIKP